MAARPAAQPAAQQRHAPRPGRHQDERIHFLDHAIEGIAVAVASIPRTPPLPARRDGGETGASHWPDRSPSPQDRPRRTTPNRRPHAAALPSRCNLPAKLRGCADGADRARNAAEIGASHASCRPDWSIPADRAHPADSTGSTMPPVPCHGHVIKR
ncbi:hypothetical protein GLE_1650 [Lysobacter enzymogenes]|uniref:Uncharacterized protein n=1 Tax=Lysobacter enzymogenes TaxID=69 RepID=A0A0S2DFB2_LYSEN|nr:hypothetical protein GLE_1650 [Lysobacter enzymogenes]